MNAKEKMEKSRTQFVLRERYFATILMNLPPIEDKSCPTMWTDGRRIGYNPQWVEQQSDSQLTFSNIHEMMHVTNRHHLRRGERDPREWNICCDLSINPVIVSMDYKAPKGILFEEKYVGKTPEEIYDIRRNNKQEEEEKEDEGSGAGENQETEDEGESDGAESGQDNGEDNKEDEKEGDSGVAGSEEGGEENQEQDQKQDSGDESEEEQEISDSDPGQCGEVRDMKNEDGTAMSEADKSAAEAMTKIMIAQAARVAEQAGQMTDGMKRMIGELQAPTQNWREELSQFLQQYAKNDYTWMVPNRRYVHAGLYLPSMRNQELGNVVLVLDSSGSISDSLWNIFISEMKSLMEMFNLTLTVITCDDHIQDVKENVTADDMCELHPLGYGGTDFRPPFKWLEENGYDPTLLIYFTDLDCYSFPDEPSYPVVWASWGYEKAPFGHVIKVK